jgi:hypothetical protein
LEIDFKNSTQEVIKKRGFDEFDKIQILKYCFIKDFKNNNNHFNIEFFKIIEKNIIQAFNFPCSSVDFHINDILYRITDKSIEGNSLNISLNKISKYGITSKDLYRELTKNKLNNVLSIINNLKDPNQKIESLLTFIEIDNNLMNINYKKIFLKEAVSLASSFSNHFNEKNYAYSKIAIAYFKIDMINYSEELCHKISDSLIRKDTFQQIGQAINIKYEFKKSFELLKRFKTKEAQNIIQNKIVMNLNVQSISEDILLELILKKCFNYNEIKYVLSIFIIDKIFFSKLPKEKKERYNRALNLQWAIDIKKQLPN